MGHPPGMPPFTTRLATGWRRALEHLPLALVPFVSALLATEKVERVATFQGGHVGLRLGLPVSVVDLWQFVNVPDETVSTGLPLPEALPLLVVAVPLAVVVRAALLAGYLGSLEGALRTGSYDFFANVRRHFVPFLVYTLLPLVVVAPLAVLDLTDGRSVGPAVLVLLPVVLVASYLFYAAPYLVVLQRTDLLAALRASYALAVAGGPYFRFALGYAGFVAAVSLVATAVVVNLGLAGVALGAVALSPVGLACNAATMRFVADVDEASPELGRWDDGPTVDDPQP